MKAERSSDELKILELFKSNNIELGIQLCKAVGLDVIDLLASWFDDFEKGDELIINDIYICKGSNNAVWWCWWGVVPPPLWVDDHTAYKDHMNYKEFAAIVYTIYCELKLKNK